MTISGRVNTVFCTQTSSHNGTPRWPREREAKTRYFCASRSLRPNARGGLCEDSMEVDTGDVLNGERSMGNHYGNDEKY